MTTTAGATDHGARILVVEDDVRTAAEVVVALRRDGFQVELANDGAHGAQLALRGDFDLLLVDISLPSMDGLSILGTLAGRISTPAIVLSAHPGLPVRLRAFEHGAVDWVSKPFFVDELLARIRLRLRLPLAGARAEHIEFDDVRVDVAARRVLVAGADVALTPSETNLLLYLLARPGRAIARRQLAADALSGRGSAEDAAPSERTVDSHLARVRQKLGAAGARIRTVWGIGYCFDAPRG